MLLILLAAASVIVLFVVTQSVSRSSPEKQNPNYEAIARIKEWIDGDTIRVEILRVPDPHRGIQVANDKVRLAGIDTEETTRKEAAKEHSEVENMSQQEYEKTNYYERAIEAKEFVKSLAPSGSKIYLDIDDLAYGKDPYRGYYGRIIALVYVKDESGWTNLNAKLLRKGRSTKSRKKLASITPQYDSEFKPETWLSEDYSYS